MKHTTEMKWHSWLNGVVLTTCPSMLVRQRSFWWTSGDHPSLTIDSSTVERVSSTKFFLFLSLTFSNGWKEQVSLHSSSPLSTGEPWRACWPAASLSGTGTVVQWTARPSSGEWIQLQKSSVPLSPPSWIFSLHDAQAKPIVSHSPSHSLFYVCIHVAPWSCEARHFVPLYVHTCSGMTIKLNLTLLKWPPQSPDLNPIEHLWDVVEREIRIMDVQPTNLQQLRHAIMSIRTKISEECFQHLVQSHEELSQFWTQKAVQPGTSNVYLIKWPLSVYFYIYIHRERQREVFYAFLLQSWIFSSSSFQCHLQKSF